MNLGLKRGQMFVQNERMMTTKRIVLILILGSLFALFFIGGPDFHASRSLKSFWNLGHILFFSLLPLLLLNTSKTSKSYPQQVLYIVVLTIVIGTLVEVLQTGLDNRIPDMGDIFRNIIGSLVGLVFFLPSRKNIPKKRLLIIQTLVVLLVMLQLMPILKAFWDENMAERQFPLLSGFETPFEIDRWTGGAKIEIEKDAKNNGDFALKVMLNTETYSGVGLKYFPGNWEGYRFFQFSVFNPQETELKLTCRIHDWQHTQGRQVYADRFNQSYSILQGWNTITIPLEQVKAAPENRQMDMQRIQGVGIFTIRLPQSRIIYIDDVRLTKW